MLRMHQLWRQWSHWMGSPILIFCWFSRLCCRANHQCCFYGNNSNNSSQTSVSCADASIYSTKTFSPPIYPSSMAAQAGRNIHLCMVHRRPLPLSLRGFPEPGLLSRLLFGVVSVLSRSSRPFHCHACWALSILEAWSWSLLWIRASMSWESSSRGLSWCASIWLAPTSLCLSNVKMVKLMLQPYYLELLIWISKLKSQDVFQENLLTLSKEEMDT